jgi:hypothetical protein
MITARSGPAAATAHRTGPTGPGTVVLDLGEDTGALVLEAPAELSGREIEISPSGGAKPWGAAGGGATHGAAGGGATPSGASWGGAAGGGRTHALVRERRTAAGTSYAAVYPGLPAGDYIVWLDEHTAAGTVTVHPGQAARFRWPR